MNSQSEIYVPQLIDQDVVFHLLSQLSDNLFCSISDQLDVMSPTSSLTAFNVWGALRGNSCNCYLVQANFLIH